MTLKVGSPYSAGMTSNFSIFCTAVATLTETVTRLFTSKPAPTLPIEILTKILCLVAEPGRTAKVCKLWRDVSQSEYVYTNLIQQYQAYRPLANYVAEDACRKLEPKKAVKYVFMRIRYGADKLNVDIKKLLELSQETDRFSPIFLKQAYNLNWEKFLLRQKVLNILTFYGALLVEHIPLPEKIEERHIQYFESRIDADVDLCRKIASLDLRDFSMSYLTPKVGNLIALRDLCISGNKFEKLPLELKNCRALKTLDIGQNRQLSIENVKEICMSLPLLKRVIVENSNTKMIEMFRTHLPHLRITIVSLDPLEQQQ